MGLTEGVLVALVTGAVAVLLALVAWVRFRRKDKVEVKAQEVATKVSEETYLNDRFKTATEMSKYIREEVDKAVKQETEELAAKVEQYRSRFVRIESAFRIFFTQLWMWDRSGRPGVMPAVPDDIMRELRLDHLIGLPAEDTEPLRKEMT
jgi:hypothetical protein